MASFNSSIFLGLLVAISAFMAAPSPVEAQIPLINSIVRTNGTVRCATNITLSLNGTMLGIPPPFANASVELRCGNRSLANTTTDASGIFNIAVSLVQSLITNIPNIFSLLLNPSNCNVVVNTPLVQCNSTLPSVGRLLSNVTQIVTTIVNGVPTITLVTSPNFQLTI